MRVLIAGETWMSYGIHVKGFSAYHTGGYGSGIAPLLEALTRAGIEVVHLPNHLATEEFPRTPQALSEFDVVILSDIGADTLLLHPDVLERSQRIEDPLRAIERYVDGGGGLLMIGGYMSFSGFDGRARYHNTVIAEILPVSMCGYDDRIEEPSGVIPIKVVNHSILDGIPEEWPFLLGYNRLIAKPGGQVLVRVGDDPILTVGTYGKGRSAAFASDCSPHWGSVAFTSWEGYATLWSQLLKWLDGG